MRLSTEPGTRSLYFHQNSLTPDGRLVIVETPAGIGTIELATRRNELIVPGKVHALFVGRRSGLVYFSRGEGAGDSARQAPTEIFSVPATGGKPKRIARIARGFIGSVNADETLLLGVYAEEAWQLEQGPRDPRFDANYAARGPDGKPLKFVQAKEVRLLQREQARIPMAMFTVNTATGEQTIIHRSTDWLNHLQFSPTDPQALMFCHEGPWHRVDRIWSMRLGSEPQLVHRRGMNWSRTRGTANGCTCSAPGPSRTWRAYRPPTPNTWCIQARSRPSGWSTCAGTTTVSSPTCSSRATANGSCSVPTCTATCTRTWWRSPGAVPDGGRGSSFHAAVDVNPVEVGVARFSVRVE
ncbi:MAG TPA: hypothetical protein VFS13_20090 [Steroidobacteraceae bacterium]|nr:hypothetical protein [Steroidobacteraceae bacterium]